MGSEPWSNFTPFQPDINKALHDLQDEVFARGEFDRPYAEIDFLDDMNFFDVSSDEREEMILTYGFSVLREPIDRVGIAGLRQWLVDLNSAPRIATRDDLRLLNCFCTDGTRSILDMQRISPEPEFGCISPMPATEILRTYGTERPTREMLEENREAFWNIPRGHGLYLLLYEKDQEENTSSEIYFHGYSFD